MKVFLIFNFLFVDSDMVLNVTFRRLMIKNKRCSRPTISRTHADDVHISADHLSGFKYSKKSRVALEVFSYYSSPGNLSLRYSYSGGSLPRKRMMIKLIGMANITMK